MNESLGLFAIRPQNRGLESDGLLTILMAG